jgi:ATP-dependent Lon protease
VARSTGGTFADSVALICRTPNSDLDDLREPVRGELRIHPVADVGEVLELALEPSPVAAA